MNENNGNDTRCLNCKWVRLQPNNIQVGLCRLDRPQVVVAGMTAQGPAIMAVETQVPLDYYCSHFEKQAIIVPAGTIPFPEMPRREKG
jgi:hypothetical protein